MKNEIDRFWARVQKTDTCWIWQGDPSFWHHQGKEQAVAYAYRLYYGQPIDGYYVHQTCKNNKCINPNHLFIDEKRCNPLKQKYQYNLNTFYNEDDISYYLLGAYLTDGNLWTSKDGLGTSVRITSKDIDWLEIIKQYTCSDSTIHIVNDRYGVLHVNSKDVYDWFVSKGLSKNKTLTVDFPQIPEQYLSDFIRGCIDGDGTVYLGLNKTKQCYTYHASLCGASEKFMKKFHNITSKNFNVSFIAFPPGREHMMKNGKMLIQKHTYYQSIMYASDAVKFLEWIYYPGHRLSMPRKSILAANAIKAYHAYKSRKVPLSEQFNF